MVRNPTRSAPRAPRSGGVAGRLGKPSHRGRWRAALRRGATAAEVRRFGEPGLDEVGEAFATALRRGMGRWGVGEGGRGGRGDFQIGASATGLPLTL